MTVFQTIHFTEFTDSTGWQYTDSAGVPQGALTVAEASPSEWVAVANRSTPMVGTAATQFAYDPNSMYRMSVRFRCFTAPSVAGNAYSGLAGVLANGTTWNSQTGGNQISNQCWCANRQTAQAAQSPYATYTGYVTGRGTTLGPANSPSAAIGMHPNTAFIRPLTWQLLGSTDGTAYVNWVRLEKADGAALKPSLATLDGLTVAFPEIVEWPERVKPRSSSTLAIMGRPDPVVLFDKLRSSSSTITFLTRTEAERTALLAVLNADQSLVLSAPCYGVNYGQTFGFVALEVNERRVTNSGTDLMRYWDVQVQNVG